MSMAQMLISFFIDDIKESAEKYAAKKNDTEVENECLMEACEVLIRHIDPYDVSGLLKRLSYVATDVELIEDEQKVLSDDEISSLVSTLNDAAYDLTNTRKHSVSMAWGIILQPIVHVLHLHSENMSEAKKAMAHKVWMDS
ncbi:hypothetical protein LMH73_016950 [Vibrio splendidus]|nr:hypothetical protein [Vibrio splendidus]MCC4881846.1 hypothetical protein [Vibrio splendidus]